MQRKMPVFLILFLFPLFCLHAQNDPLPSWNDGLTKEAILGFVAAAKDISNTLYIPPANRIATFDQDGTLWVEHPLYTEGVFALDRVKALASDHPEWKDQPPFKDILNGNRQAIENFTDQDWVQIVAATHTGMTTDTFKDIVKQWINSAKHPRFQRLYTELVYQPMIELLEYLRSNSFKIYIVTGGGQEFVRVFSLSVYGIPSEQVIGSSVATQYEYSGGKPVLMMLPKVFLMDNFAGKAIGINLFIGKRPSAAFGNSTGDRQMLELTQGGTSGAKLMMLVLHDDPDREYAYGPADGLPNTEVGTFSDSLMSEAKKNGWAVISMKRDWKTIFPFQKDRLANHTNSKVEKTNQADACCHGTCRTRH